MASNRSSRWISTSLSFKVVVVLAVAALGRVASDEAQTDGVPNASLLCISECGTCPVICSSPPTPPPPKESGTLPPLMPTPLPPGPPTPSLEPPSPFQLPPSAPLVGYSPPPSYHAHPPPAPPPPKGSSSSPSVSYPKSATPPPNLPWVIVPGGPSPPIGQGGSGNNYPYPYYYYYSKGSLSTTLNGYCFTVLLLLLIHVCLWRA